MGLTGAVDLAAWTPYTVRMDEAGPVIRWCHSDGIEFTDPYFGDTIERCLAEPFRLLFWRETGIDALAGLARSDPGLAPAGFILHMSRCGSTLVSQMLAGLPAALVISEAGPIDTILRSGSPDAAQWLAWIVSALGRRRRPEQSALVVKLDAWSILDLPVIRRAFPQVPCVFIYRDPLEVLVSHLSRRGYHVIPGTLSPERLGLRPEEAAGLGPERYIAAVHASLCEAAITAARAGELTLVDYRSLPAAVPDVVAPLFGIEVGERERQLFARIARFDAKNPSVPFEVDGPAKLQRVTATARAAVAGRATAAYEALGSLTLAAR